LTPHKDLRFKISKFQRQAAYELYHKSRYGHLGYGPLPGPEIPEAPITLRVPWQPVLAGVIEGKHVGARNIPAGTPMLSKYQCLQPFRLCNVPRKRASTTQVLRAREGFQRSLMDQQRDVRRAEEIEHLTFDEAGPHGPQVDEYHSWLDEGMRVCYADFDVVRPWLGSEEWEPMTPEVLEDLAQPSWSCLETILLEQRRQDIEEGN